jgi:hypothetical protein
MMIEGAGGVGGIWVFRTTSYNSVTGLASSLMLVRAITGGVLANIPLKLRVQPKQASSPTDGAAVLIYVVSVEFAGDIDELQQMGHKIALDRSTAHVSIAHIEEEARRLLELPMPANAVLPGDDPDAITAEFYQEETGEIDPRPTREQFQEKPTAPPHDAETGEIIDNEGQEPETAEGDVELLASAVTAAKGGTETFRVFWAALDKDGRVPIISDLEKYREIANKADAERAGGEAEPPKQEEPVERPTIFDELDWQIMMPMMQNKTPNYQILRDTLCNLVGHCESGAELQKLAVDNKKHLEALVKEAPKYAELIQEMIDTRKQVLAQGEGR